MHGELCIISYLCNINEKKCNNMEDLEMKSQLPDNAFRELKEGEQYEPVMAPHKAYPEVNG